MKTTSLPIAFALGTLITLLGDDQRLIAAQHPVPESPLWLRHSGDQGPRACKHIFTQRTTLWRFCGGDSNEERGF